SSTRGSGRRSRRRKRQPRLRLRPQLRLHVSREAPGFSSLPGGGRGQGEGGESMLAKFFIERPVLANVIAFVTILLGLVAVGLLPVSEYPRITPPTVQVTTTYPGASAKTLVETVALPIEQQVNGVEKMLYMQSNCTSDGRYTLTVTFQVGTDLDFA